MSNITSLVISLIIDFIAIGLSIYFFIRTRKSEKTADTLLKETKEQIDSLRGISKDLIIERSRNTNDGISLALEKLNKIGQHLNIPNFLKRL